MHSKIKLSWRIIWYSVIIWLAEIVVSGFVILPWFYLAMPLVVLGITVVYLQKEILPSLAKRRKHDRILVVGLSVSLIWFFALLGFDVLQIIGPYYANAQFYFSDFRNWFLFELILLVPFVYSLMLENRKYRKKKSSRLIALSKGIHA